MAIADRYPRVWTLWAAARPSQLALIALVYALGVGIALRLGQARPIEWQAVGTGMAALAPVAVSIHYANEYADAETDRLTERTPFSGGSGALARTGVRKEILARASAATLLVGVAGATAGWQSGHLSPTALFLLGTIAVAGLAYSLPPPALIRRGVGEVTNAVLGGTLLPLYGVAVVGELRPAALLAVVPFTLLVGCNLLATHWPDREADAAVGKRTLAVRWSPTGLRRAYWLLAGAAILSAAASLGALPTTAVAAQAVALPPLLWGGAVLTRRRSPLPAVSAMVVHAGASAVAWWWLALA